MENISVCVRIRPLNDESEDEEILFDKYDDHTVINKKTREKYEFSHVFDGFTPTKDIFNIFGQSLLLSCFEGINACIFAYGQTSSGKTHTMKGSKHSPGFIPQTLELIFQKMKEDRNFDYVVKASYIEIHNENVIDLLNDSDLEIEGDESAITQTVIKSYTLAMELYNNGEANRKAGLSNQSSKSHTIFKLSFEIKNRERPEKVLFSTLNLVDLAGSENFDISKMEGLRKKDSNAKTNLQFLTNIIGKLATKGSESVNSNDSKLIKLLQPSLEENCKAVVICTVNPLEADYQETVNTLKFGMKTSTVKASTMKASTVKNQMKTSEVIMICEEESTGKRTLNKGEFGTTGDMIRSNVIEVPDVIEILSAQEEANEGLRKKSNEKIKELEKKLKAEIEKNAAQRVEKEIMIKEMASFKERNAHLEVVSSKLKKDYEQLLQILKEMERETTEHFDKKSAEFQRNLNELDKKLKSVDEEKILLKQENMKLKHEVSNLENLRIESNKEKNELINHYKDHIANLKKNVDVLNPGTSTTEKTDKADKTDQEANKENLQFTSFNTQNIINMTTINKYSKYGTMYQGFGDDDLELRFLEMETSLKAQIMQKNRIINDLNSRVVDLTKRNLDMEQRLSSYENEFINIKTRTPSVFEEGDSLDSYISKKRKLNDYNYIQKRIKDSPDKETLKKEVKYLENKTKNYEKQLQRKRAQEEEYTMTIQDIMKKNMDLEFKINFENLR